MSLVIDTSISIVWVATDESSALAESAYRRVLAQGGVVPGLWFTEMANVLLKKVRKGHVALADVQGIVDDLRLLRIEQDDMSESKALNETLRLAHRHRLTAYDAVYLELAQRRSIPLATRDAELQAAAKAEGVAVLEG